MSGFRLTAYCDCDCTTGGTCTKSTNQKILAVGPGSGIHLGDEVIVFNKNNQEVLIGRAEDTGGAVFGKKIDVWVDGLENSLVAGSNFDKNGPYTVCVKDGKLPKPRECTADNNPDCKQTTCSGQLGWGDRGLCRGP
jgi:3D (Asp-Asp-Asp) domain-containing protein